MRMRLPDVKINDFEIMNVFGDNRDVVMETRSGELMLFFIVAMETENIFFSPEA